MRPIRILHPLILLAVLAFSNAARADEISPKYRQVVRKGLDYLARQQAADGHWGGNGYPTGSTGLCAMAMLMEGSTINDGRYARNIRKAVNWFMDQSQSNGLLRAPREDFERMRYMHGHGFGLLFLASVYGEEENGRRRDQLGEILTRAVAFTVKSQLSCGGWCYRSRLADGGYDEVSVTACQVQALRAAKNAGIAVPTSVIDKARAYLERLTTPHGAVAYSLMTQAPNVPESWYEGHAGLTASALVALFSTGDYHSPLAKKWIAFCQRAIPISGPNKTTLLWAYTHYHYAQAVYVLGDDRYVQLFPASIPSERLMWSKYRATLFEAIASLQKSDGSWPQTDLGGIPLLTDAWLLTILQLDKGSLPIYQR